MKPPNSATVFGIFWFGFMAGVAVEHLFGPKEPPDEIDCIHCACPPLELLVPIPKQGADI